MSLTFCVQAHFLLVSPVLPCLGCCSVNVCACAFSSSCSQANLLLPPSLEWFMSTTAGEERGGNNTCVSAATRAGSSGKPYLMYSCLALCICTPSLPSSYLFLSWSCPSAWLISICASESQRGYNDKKVNRGLFHWRLPLTAVNMFLTSIVTSNYCVLNPANSTSEMLLSKLNIVLRSS